MTLYELVYALLLVVPAYYLYRRASGPAAPAETNDQTLGDEKPAEEPKTIMQPARTDLDPPKEDPFTLEQLKEFDGSDPSKPLYVSIKGQCCGFTCLFGRSRH